MTSLPVFVLARLQGMPGVWKSCHRLLLGWLIVLHALLPGRTPLADLARWTPDEVTSWRWRRVRKATSWDVHRLGAWGAQQALNTLPPPEDGGLTLTGAGRHKPTRGTNNPLAQQGRNREPHAWVFGMRFALRRVRGDGGRGPVAFRLLRRTSPPQSRTENALLRDMVRSCTPPAWAQAVIVEGDAAYGSPENMPMGRQRDADDPERPWGLLLAMARPWQTAAGQASKDLVTPVPRTYAQRPWGPRMPSANGRQTLWPYRKRVWLRPSGDGTVGWSTTGRNGSPQPTKILGTKRAELTPRDSVFASQRRWAVAPIHRELQTDLGMGQHQVSRAEGRLEKSFGSALRAYGFVIRACHHDVVPGQSWRLAQLQHAFRFQGITHQVEHNVKTRLTQSRKAA